MSNETQEQRRVRLLNQNLDMLLDNAKEAKEHLEYLEAFINGIKFADANNPLIGRLNGAIAAKCNLRQIVHLAKTIKTEQHILATTDSKDEASK